MVDLWSLALGSPGRRIYAAILVLAVVYALMHLTVGPWLVLDSLAQGSPFIALVVTVTVVTALASALHIAQSLVFSGVLLLRGPKRFVAPPAAVPDQALPTVVIQIAGRNEPLEEVVRSIRSGLALDYPSGKLLVQHIDNSDDERWQAVAALFREDDRVQVIHRKGTQGAKARNLNLGLERLAPAVLAEPCRVLIGIIDVGDTFAPRSVRPMATEFLHDSDLAYVQSITRIANPQDTVITQAESYLADATFRFFFGMQNTYGMPNLYGHHMLVRLQPLLRAGRWDETKVAEDWVTAVRMLVAGGRGKWVDYAPTDPSVVSAEMSPATLEAQQKQKSRWATGGTELVRDHLGEWMRSPLPWNHRLDLLIRLWFYPTRLLQFAGRLLLPLWVTLAVLLDEASTLPEFGLFSASLQSGWLIYRGAEAVSYLREGRFRRAWLLVLHVPLQTAYTLAMLPQIAHGVLKGFRHTVNAFVITPKQMQRIGLRRFVMQQRASLLLATLAASPAVIFLALDPPGGPPLGILSLFVLAVLIVVGVFMVPVGLWLQRLRRPPRRGAGPSAED